MVSTERVLLYHHCKVKKMVSRAFVSGGWGDHLYTKTTGEVNAIKKSKEEMFLDHVVKEETCGVILEHNQARKQTGGMSGERMFRVKKP